MRRRLRRARLYAGAVTRLVGRLGWEVLRFVGGSTATGVGQLLGVALAILLIPLAVLAFGVYLRVTLLVVLVLAVLGIGLARRP